MRKSYKTELKPNIHQAAKLRRTIGICRFVYNKYIQINLERRAQADESDGGEHSWFVDAAAFSVQYLPHIAAIHAFVASCPAAFIEAVLQNGEVAFRRYFQGKARLPRFKARPVNQVSLIYPLRLAARWQIQDDAVTIPGLGRLKLKEQGYLPSGIPIIKGSISYSAGWYFISATVQQNDIEPINSAEYTGGIGVYVDEHSFITLDDGTQIEDIEKSRRIIALKRKIAREMRSLSRRSHEPDAANYHKQQEKLMKLRVRLEQMRIDHINKIAALLIQKKPAYIIWQDLQIRRDAESSDTLKQKLRDWKLSELKSRLLTKCRQLGIELRTPKTIEIEQKAADDLKQPDDSEYLIL